MPVAFPNPNAFGVGAVVEPAGFPKAGCPPPPNTEGCEPSLPFVFELLLAGAPKLNENPDGLVSAGLASVVAPKTDFVSPGFEPNPNADVDLSPPPNTLGDPDGVVENAFPPPPNEPPPPNTEVGVPDGVDDAPPPNPPNAGCEVVCSFGAVEKGDENALLLSDAGALFPNAPNPLNEGAAGAAAFVVLLGASAGFGAPSPNAFVAGAAGFAEFPLPLVLGAGGVAGLEPNPKLNFTGAGAEVDAAGVAADVDGAGGAAGFGAEAPNNGTGGLEDSDAPGFPKEKPDPPLAGGCGCVDGLGANPPRRPSSEDDPSPLDAAGFCSGFCSG